MVISAQLIGYITLALGIWATYIYIASIFRGQSKPHVFTWFIWGLISGIVYFAQYQEHAGPGAWAMAVTSLSCLLTAALGLKYGEKNITRSDWISLWASLLAIIPWVLMDDPLWSVVLVTIIDIIAFWPTLRKSWAKPSEENIFSYNIHSFKFVLSFFAMTNITLTSVLYPAAIIILNTIFAIGATLRRKQLIKLQQS